MWPFDFSVQGCERPTGDALHRHHGAQLSRFGPGSEPSLASSLVFTNQRCFSSFRLHSVGTPHVQTPVARTDESRPELSHSSSNLSYHPVARLSRTFADIWAAPMPKPQSREQSILGLGFRTAPLTFHTTLLRALPLALVLVWAHATVHVPTATRVT